MLKEMLILNQPLRSLGHCMGSGGDEPDPLLAIERKYGNRNAAREEGKKLGVLLITWSFFILFYLILYLNFYQSKNQVP